MDTPCPACGSTSKANTFEIVDHEYNLDIKAHYAQCAECQTLFQDPMPDVQTLSSYYPKDYHSFDTNALIASLKHSRRLKSISSHLNNDTFTLLDYGCGGGAFLEFVAKKFPRARFIGFEIAPKKEIFQKLDGRVKIINGSFEDLLQEKEPVDIISMHHVIEHLPDPYETLKHLADWIKPGGYFCGQTPACDSQEFAIFKANWSGFHAPRHTVIFSKSGMSAFLKRCGFNDARVKGGFNPGGIAVSLASLGHKGKKGRIKRAGLSWLFFVGLATLCYPLDLLSGKPGIMDFGGKK